jgi:hypothetical protein
VVWSDHNHIAKNSVPSIGTALRWVTASRAAFASAFCRTAENTASSAPAVKNDIVSARTKIIVKLISSLGKVGNGLFKASHLTAPRSHMTKAPP